MNSSHYFFATDQTNYMKSFQELRDLNRIFFSGYIKSTKNKIKGLCIAYNRFVYNFRFRILKNGCLIGFCLHMSRNVRQRNQSKAAFGVPFLVITYRISSVIRLRRMMRWMAVVILYPILTKFLKIEEAKYSDFKVSV